MDSTVANLDCAFSLVVLEDESGPGRTHTTVTHYGWSDVMTVKGCREILAGSQYPDEATRRSLYASWLRVVASGLWRKDFDYLMLNCVAATPSPSKPSEAALFADMFEDASDMHVSENLVLKGRRVPTMFRVKSYDVEPLPESSDFFRFMANLIRKGNREALDEAGMIIGFFSLAMAAVVVKPPKNVQDFLAGLMKRALASAVVPTTFAGEIPCLRSRFLAELAKKADSPSGVVKPHIVLLAAGQYSYHTSTGERSPRADVKFLEEAFIEPARLAHLEVVELFSDVQDKVGLDSSELCQIFADDAPDTVSASSERVRKFLECARKPTNVTLPWCRAASKCFASELALNENLDYALRLLAFLAPNPEDQLWKKREYANISESRIQDARKWARNFKRALRKGKYGDLPNWKP